MYRILVAYGFEQLGLSVAQTLDFGTRFQELGLGGLQILGEVILSRFGRFELLGEFALRAAPRRRPRRRDPRRGGGVTLYLSRLTLSRAPSTQALKQLVDPGETGPRMDAHHRLIWGAFADIPDRERDFLWRDDGAGRFITLSARPPQHAALFEPPEVRPFAPDLRAGDRLSFVLRANATRTVKTEALAPNGKPRRKHRDLVMELLHDVPGARSLADDQASRRPALRQELAETAAVDWFDRQGEGVGFRPIDLHVANYDAVTLPGHRGHRAGSPRIGLLDLSGTLEVADPEAFVAGLARGFGRVKAFGCGLMLIARI